jgi:hypothetical protein
MNFTEYSKWGRDCIEKMPHLKIDQLPTETKYEWFQFFRDFELEDALTMNSQLESESIFRDDLPRAFFQRIQEIKYHREQQPELKYQRSMLPMMVYVEDRVGKYRQAHKSDPPKMLVSQWGSEAQELFDP